MERDEALRILQDTVRDDLKHENYKRTVEVAEKCYRYVTGVGLDDEMQRFVQRESLEMFDQRKRLTKHIIPTVVKSLIDVQYKVPRSNSLTRVLEYDNEEGDTKAVEFENILGKFWGNKSFDDYMGIRFIELNNLDPNTFVVIEFKDFDYLTEHLQPYPFEVSSKMAVNYEFDNNILQFLIAQQDARYTMYTPERAYILDILTDKDPRFNEIKSFLNKSNEWTVVAGEVYIRFDNKVDKIFHLIEPEPYDLDDVPAYRVGYKRDMTTNGDTYVSPWWDTLPLLEKTLKANSELDLSMCLHAFPQKVITGKKCENTNCLGGKVYNSDKNYWEICETCHGVGMLPHTSAQDVVIVDLPGSKEEQLSLDNIVRYIYPPVDLIQFQDEYIDKLTWKAKQTMFNSDIFTREEVAETATGKNIDLQNVYDTLWPLAVKQADTWVFFVRVIASLTDMDTDLVAVFVYDKDFKMKTTTELYADLQKANESGADSFAIMDIQQDIARNIFANNPEEFRKYIVRQMFYPFSGKTTEEKIYIKTSGNTTRFNKVLDDNYGNIFDMIELETPEFYMMTKDKQWEILQAKVEELIKEIDAETPQTQTVFE